MGDVKYSHISPIQVLYFQHVYGLPILTYNMGFVQGPESTLISAFSSAITTFMSKSGVGLIKRISFRKYGREYSILFIREHPVIMVAFLSALRKETVDLLLKLSRKVARSLGIPESWDGKDIENYRKKLREIIVEVFQLKKLAKEIEKVNQKVRETVSKYHELESQIDQLLKMSMTGTVPEAEYLKKVEKLRKKMEDLRKKYEELTGDPVVPQVYYERRIFLDLGLEEKKNEKRVEKITLSVTPDIESIRQKIISQLGVSASPSSSYNAGARIIADLESMPQQKEAPKPQRKVAPAPTYELDVLKKKLISLIREQEKEV